MVDLDEFSRNMDGHADVGGKPSGLFFGRTFTGKTMGFHKFYSKSPWDGMIQRGSCGRCV